MHLLFRNDKEFICPDCGWNYFHNPAAAVGAIIEVDEHLLLLVRGQEPHKDKLDFPGGFADPGETLEEALIRECFEELHIKLSLKNIHYYCSFPNTYEYKDILYNTCDVFFRVFPDALVLTPDNEEIAEVKWINKNKLKPENMAFESGRKVIREYKKKKVHRCDLQQKFN